jgi:hypothetical protein
VNVVGDVAFCGASPHKRSSLLPHTLRVSSRDFPQARVSIRVPHCRKIFRSRFSFPLLYLLIPVPPSLFSYFWLFSILFYSVFCQRFLLFPRRTEVVAGDRLHRRVLFLVTLLLPCSVSPSFCGNIAISQGHHHHIRRPFCTFEQKVLVSLFCLIMIRVDVVAMSLFSEFAAKEIYAKTLCTLSPL